MRTVTWLVLIVFVGAMVAGCGSQTAGAGSDTAQNFKKMNQAKNGDQATP